MMCRLPRFRSRCTSPSWWPEGEAWPPRNSAWRSRRQRSRFMVRAFVAASIMMALGWLGVSAVVSLLTSAARGAEPRGPLWSATIALLFLFTVVAFLRIVRRVGPPLGDLVAAAHRVADGDFAV